MSQFRPSQPSSHDGHTQPSLPAMPSQPLPYMQPGQYEQPQQRPPQRKRPQLWLVLAAVILVLIVGTLAAKAISSATVTPAPSIDSAATATAVSFSASATAVQSTAAADLTQEAMTPPPPSPTPVPTQPPNPHGDIGVTQNSGYWTVTVNSIKTSQGDLVAPKAGDTYIVINVTARNTDTSTHLISVIDFSLRGPDGTSFPYGAMQVQEPSGNVLGGQPIRGDVVFEAPVSVHDFTMQFNGDFNPADTAQWNLSV